MEPEFDQQVASAASNETVNSFYKTYSEGDLVLRPPFQRNLVWNAEQQSFLVDSILRGLPVPEIYIQRETTSEGDEKTIVVDGQQRITTCIRFLANDLRLVGSDVVDSRWANRTFGELDASLRKRFRSFELIVRKLPALNEDVLREVFRRLNKTVEPLEPQELRHAAYSGPLLSLVEQAASRSVLSDIGVFSPKDYLRRRNDELMAEIALAVLAGAFPNKKDGLDDLFLTYEKQGQPAGTIDELGKRFGRVFSELDEVALTLRRTRFRNKSDFYSLFVFLARKADVLPIAQAARALFLQALKDFSGRVNDIKRVEGEGKSVDNLTADPMGAEAQRYLRAVERAASDRLSRVRREEALDAALGPSLEGLASTPLSEADSAWRSARPSSEDQENDAEAMEGKDLAEAALLGAEMPMLPAADSSRHAED
jgi:hypothetical protein